MLKDENEVQNMPEFFGIEIIKKTTNYSSFSCQHNTNLKYRILLVIFPNFKGYDGHLGEM